MGVVRYPAKLLLALASIAVATAPLADAASAADTVPLERLTWRHRNPRPIGQGFMGLVAGSDCFIIYSSGGLVMRSANGVLWDIVPFPYKGSLLQGRFVEGEFLLVGGADIFTSPDGWNWTSRRLPQLDDGTFPSIETVDRRGRRWAALARHGVYVSENGTDWELWPITAPGGYLNVALGDDRVIVLKAYFYDHAILTATGPDGWTEKSLSFLHNYSQFFYIDGRFFATGQTAIGTSVDGVSWELAPLPATLFDSMARSGSEWLFAEFGSNRYHTSSDAITWTQHTCDAFELLGRIARREGATWVGTGDAAGIATSTDGVHWTRRDSGVAPPMSAIARIGDRWVAAGGDGTVISSTDGLEWTQQVIGSAHEWFFQMVADEDVVYLRSDLGAFSTTDGVNWSPAASLPPTQWDFSAIPSPYVPSFTPVWVGDRWLLPANIPLIAAGALFSSTNGTDWTMLLQTPGLMVSVAGRPGKYVACGSAGTGIRYSTDAVTWESIPLEDTYYESPNIVLEGYGWFLAGTSRGILASHNGRNWEWLPGITSQIHGGARIGESFWFTGEYGTIIEVMPYLEAPIANLSTRAYQRRDGLPTIAGFIIEGDEPVDVLVRAVGAGLRDYDVNDVIERPTIRLYHGPIETMTAADWASSPGRAEIEAATRHTGAFALAESGGDAAFVAGLPAGAYTAVVKGGSVAQGNILVEVYDSGSTEGASAGGRLANSSTRGEATTDHPLIGGLIIKGDHPRRVLVRGIGPGLLDFAVATAAPDPRLEIYRGQDVIASNDNWDEATDPLLTIDAGAVSGAFALKAGARDAAVVLTLGPGLYTVHVRPATGTASGEVLLETYYLD